MDLTYKHITVCDNFEQYTDVIAQITNGWHAKWYRGIRSPRNLLPKIFRDISAKNGFNTRFSDLNEDFLNESIGRKLGFFSSDSHRMVEALCLAQHLHFPTRLLDWSENLATALFFALDHPDCDPCIWILEPTRLNSIFEILRSQDVRNRSSTLHQRRSRSRLVDASQISLQYIEDFRYEVEPGIFRADAETVDDFCNIALGQPSDAQGNQYESHRYYNWPVAFYPKYMNQRLLLQQAGFTIHGTCKRPIDEIVSSLPEQTQKGILQCIRFSENFKKKFIRDLYDMCPNPIQIYGDEAGLLNDILYNELWHRQFNEQRDP